MQRVLRAHERGGERLSAVPRNSDCKNAPFVRKARFFVGARAALRTAVGGGPQPKKPPFEMDEESRKTLRTRRGPSPLSPSRPCGRGRRPEEKRAFEKRLPGGIPSIPLFGKGLALPQSARPFCRCVFSQSGRLCGAGEKKEAAAGSGEQKEKRSGSPRPLPLGQGGGKMHRKMDRGGGTGSAARLRFGAGQVRFREAFWRQKSRGAPCSLRQNKRRAAVWGGLRAAFFHPPPPAAAAVEAAAKNRDFKRKNHFSIPLFFHKVLLSFPPSIKYNNAMLVGKSGEKW